VTLQIRCTHDFPSTISDAILITNRYGITRCWQVQPYFIQHHLTFSGKLFGLSETLSSPEISNKFYPQNAVQELVCDGEVLQLSVVD